MSAQVTVPPVTEEFHPIAVRLAEDFTDVTCAACGPLEHVGHGTFSAIAHGADHAMETGHRVTQRHVRVTVISERPQEAGEA